MVGETENRWHGIKKCRYCLQKKSLPWNAYSHFDIPPKPGRFQHPPAKMDSAVSCGTCLGVNPPPKHPPPKHAKGIPYKVGPVMIARSGIIYSPYKYRVSHNPGWNPFICKAIYPIILPGPSSFGRQMFHPLAFKIGNPVTEGAENFSRSARGPNLTRSYWFLKLSPGIEIGSFTFTPSGRGITPQTHRGTNKKHLKTWRVFKPSKYGGK